MAKVSLVKLLDSTSNPVIDADGDYIWVWDTSEDFTTPATEAEANQICIPPTLATDRQ